MVLYEKTLDLVLLIFNGLFDFYTHEPLKTYYAYLLWSKLADMKNQIFVDTQNKIGVFAVGASDGKKTGVMISRYFDADRLPAALPLTRKLFAS